MAGNAPRPLVAPAVPALLEQHVAIMGSNYLHLAEVRTHVTRYLHPGEAENTLYTAFPHGHILHHLSGDTSSPKPSYLLLLPFLYIYPHFLRVSAKTDGAAQS